MGFITTLTTYINQIGITVIITGAVLFGLIFYFLKIKKIGAKEEHVDTSTFDRKSSLEFLPFEDIIYKGDSIDNPGAIVLPGYQFVAGISVRGFEYSSASAQERLDAQINSSMFFNVVEDTITLRQTTSSVDLSANIEEYRNIAKEKEKEILTLRDEYERMVLTAEDYVDEPETYYTYARQLDVLKKKITSLDFQLRECISVANYMEAVSADSMGADGVGLNDNQIMFSYTYDPSQYTKELADSEIYNKALLELRRKAYIYEDALARCHFITKPLSARELYKLLYKHSKPLTGEEWDVEDILNSNHIATFVSSDSIERALRERIGEEAYEAELEAYEKAQAEERQDLELQARRDTRNLKETLINQMQTGEVQ